MTRVVRGLAAALLLLAGTARASAPPETPPVPPGSDIPAWSDRWVVDPRLRYDRVDGALVGARLTFQREGARETSAAGELTLATARARGLFRLELRQALARDNRWHLDADYHRLTRPFEGDPAGAGDMENTLAAALTGDDYRDWYEGQGGRVALRAAPRSGLTVTLAVSREEQRALGNHATWHLFGDPGFRANPAAGAGRLNAIRLDLRHAPVAPDDATALPFMDEPRARSSLAVGLTAELGRGDFDYTLLRGETRARWRLTHGQALTARMVLATAPHDAAADLPAQKTLFAGGLGGPRGHALKSMTGDRLVLASAEYAATAWRNIAGFVGADLGRAWWAAAGSPRFALDGVAGLMTRDGRLRVQWARDARAAGAPVIFSVRTRAVF